MYCFLWSHWWFLFDLLERFTVVSYNILGDRNASKHRDLYPNVSSPYMKWVYRKRVICEELIGWNPDVICLQVRFFFFFFFKKKKILLIVITIFEGIYGCKCDYIRRWIGILIYWTSWRKRDMLVLTRLILFWYFNFQRMSPFIVFVLVILRQ